MYCRVFLVLVTLLLGCGDKGTGPDTDVGPNHEVGDLIIDLPGGVKMAFIWVDQPGVLNGGFYLGKYEVTQAQWEAVMGARHWVDGEWTGSNYPVVNIPTGQIAIFPSKLNTLLESSDNELFKLPTELQWESACRAGSAAPWSFGGIVHLDTYAWYEGNSEGHLHEVGTREPNVWGLYDMNGNCSEALRYALPMPGGSISPFAGGSYKSKNIETACDKREFNGGFPSGHQGFRVLRESPKIQK